MESQLQFCRDLFSALLTCQVVCKVPSNFNAALVHGCQRLMLEAVQLQQEQPLRIVRQCLEDALQLTSRVGCLGPIEAFFTADDLLNHYQRRLDATWALVKQLQQQRQQVSGASPTHTCSTWSSNCTGSSNGSGGSRNCSNELLLDERQLLVVKTFRSHAAQLCPRLTGSCSAAVLQQLCDVVRQGLELLQGHSRLVGQEWQVEATAMLGRAEQLKVLLTHRQAHHLSLLAALLQLMHSQEVHSSPADSQQQQWQGQAAADPHGGQDAAAAARTGVAAALVTTDEAGDEQDDEFYMPIGPLARACSSAASTPRRASAAAGSALLPFDVSQDGGSTVELSGDSLVRMPSSGCSSLLEYVHSMPSATSSNAAFLETAEGSSHFGHCSSSTSYQHQLRRITEEQLQNIAGPEAAPMLAAALGVVLEGSRESSRWGSQADSAGDGSRGGSASGSSSSRGKADSSAAGCSRAVEAGRRCSCLGASCDGTGCRSTDQQQACWDVVNGPFRQMSEALVVHSGAGSRAGSPSPLSRSSSGSQLGCSSSMPGSTSPVMQRHWLRSQKQPLQQHQQQQQQWLLHANRHTSAVGSAGAVQAASCGLAGSSNEQCSSIAPPSCRSRPSSGGGQKHRRHTLRLQQTRLPAGCCRSIGAVLYISPHITRLELVAVALDDQAVIDLVDALKVNSSIVLLDLSHNAIEDIGARALARLLRERSCGSSRLRVMCLQHNQIGDDGAISLASGLSSNALLHRLWLQQNAIGPPGATALAAAMRHNTSCTSLKLLQGNDAVPQKLGQMAQQLALHNQGVRQRIKGLLQHVLLKRQE